MRYSFISAAALAFVSTAFAQTAGFDVLTEPTMGQSVAAGTALDIVWTPTEGYNNDTVTITLLQGATPATLELGPVVKASISSYIGTYSWTIPNTTAPFATYGFKLSLDEQDSIFQYSFPFHISGLASASSSSTTGAPSTTTIAISSNPSYTASSTSSTVVSSSANVTSSTSSSSSSALPTTSSSSATVSTSTTVVSRTASSTSSTSSSTSTPVPTTSSNAAMANALSGGMAMVGGLVIALAL